MRGRVEEFNIIIAGVGGQGVLTLAYTISKAAMEEGYDVKMAEVHGLSQRYGSVVCHVRFGKRVYSPLVPVAKADLILALEPLEGLRNVFYGSRERTTLLSDSKPIKPVSVYILGKDYPSLAKMERLSRRFCKEAIFVNASEKAVEISGSSVCANVYLLGKSIAEGYLPLKKESVMESVKRALKPKVYEINLKVFESAF